MQAIQAGQASSALGVNQALRSTGFSIGGALSGTVLDGSGAQRGRVSQPGRLRRGDKPGAGIWLITGMICYLFTRLGGAAAAGSGTKARRRAHRS